MSSAVILQHVAHEGPGRIVPLLRDYGIPVQLRRLYQGDEVPTDLDEVRVLILLGGPMSVADVGTPAYPYLAKEVEVLKRFIAADRPVLGICLGAAAIGPRRRSQGLPQHQTRRKTGRPPGPRPRARMGSGHVPLPRRNRTHRHGIERWLDDVPLAQRHLRFAAPPAPSNPPPPNTPTGNALLSSSKLCKNQAFRFENRLFGFQYHFEFTEPDIEAVIVASRKDYANVLGAEKERKIRQDTAKFLPRYTRQGELILRNFVQYLKVY